MVSESKVIQELGDIFRQYRERFAVLHSIDHELLHGGDSVDQFLLSLRERMRGLFRVDCAGIYAVTGENCLALGDSLDETWPSLDDETSLPDSVYEGSPVTSLSGWPTGGIFSLLIRVDVSPSLFLLFVLADKLTPDDSPLADKDAVELAERIRSQIKALSRHCMEKRLHQLERGVLESFFDKQLKPTVCWKAIVDQVTAFLPQWHPLAATSETRAQLLTWSEGDRYVVLRASSSAAEKDLGAMENIPGPNPIRADSSMCGLAIQTGQFPFCVNPLEQHEGRYAAYLWAKDIPGTELILPICHEDELFALLNVENMTPGAFHPYHIEVLERLCDFLAPLLWVLIKREERQRSKEISLQYTMGGLLKRMSKMYKHTTGQLFFKINGKLSALREAKAELDAATNEAIGCLGRWIGEVQEESNSFLVGIDQYVKDGPVDLANHIVKAIGEFDVEGLKDTQGISIQFNPPEKAMVVWASQMLSEHIFNILNNSVAAVADAILAGRVPEGWVKVDVARKRMPDKRNKETAPPRVYVTIRDNGGGVLPEDFRRIMDFDYTTRAMQGGSGLGLPAAQEYFQSKGGSLEPENHFGHGLTVIMYLHEYTPDFHRQRCLTDTQKEGDPDE